MDHPRWWRRSRGRAPGGRRGRTRTGVHPAAGALDAAQLTRTTPWSTLRRLGEELDITELAELAASISLAGTEGAKIRTSLAAKAKALRTHLVADAEADAQAATERMALPVTLLFLGFLGFIAYPPSPRSSTASNQVHRRHIMLTYYRTLWTLATARIRLLRKDNDRGEITTTVIVTALMAVLAIALIAIIAAKLTAKANSIDLGLGG
ncbi:hypothetical protein [Amycolatopsis sp. NPDC051716]|uniref:hypothetical protein n=1 Tax=Amycolatopsis sp. NPDC051716 TaxID=3155804 RepID=UPI0034355C89